MHAFLVTRVAALRRALVPRWLTWPGRYGLVVILGLVVVTGVPWSGPTAAVQASVGTPRRAATAVATTSQDPVLVVGGDIACDVGSTVTAVTCQQGATSDVVTGLGADAVLPLGDEQYQTASATAFQQMYDPSWGRVKATSHPVAGNHEYLTGGAAGYYGYFGGAAGDTGKGYYSWNIGAWHLIALNSECSQSPQIGCAAGSPQETWLKADLAANPGRCTLAYWHQPLFASGGAGSNSLYQDFWQDLYNAHADVVLNGHAHDYERFAPQTPTGAPDQAGLRQFIVGTGGKDLTGFTAPLPNEEARQDSSFGAMKLVLHQSSYDWQFLPTAGNTWTDTGSGTCHTTTSTPADPIAAHYTAVGGSGSYLGNPVGGEYDVAGGRGQDYTGGSIFYSSSTGAWAVHGAILGTYRNLGGPGGVLSFPTSDETGTPDGVGRFNAFAGTGRSGIYWTPNTGAHAVQGAIYAQWASLGYERSALGYPTSDETSTPDGVGRFNAFTGTGHSGIYWTPNTGAHAVQGAIYAQWASLGYERSGLGYPITDEYAIPGGRRNDFVHGTITWQASTNTTQTTYR